MKEDSAVFGFGDSKEREEEQRKAKELATWETYIPARMRGLYGTDDPEMINKIWHEYMPEITEAILKTDRQTSHLTYDHSVILDNIDEKHNEMMKNTYEMHEETMKNSNEMLIRLQPRKIIFFGDVPDECSGNIEHHDPYYHTFTKGLSFADKAR